MTRRVTSRALASSSKSPPIAKSEPHSRRASSAFSAEAHSSAVPMPEKQELTTNPAGLAEANLPERAELDGASAAGVPRHHPVRTQPGFRVGVTQTEPS